MPLPEHLGVLRPGAEAGAAAASVAARGRLEHKVAKISLATKLIGDGTPSGAGGLAGTAGFSFQFVVCRTIFCLSRKPRIAA